MVRTHPSGGGRGGTRRDVHRGPGGRRLQGGPRTTRCPVIYNAGKREAAAALLACAGSRMRAEQYEHIVPTASATTNRSSNCTRTRAGQQQWHTTANPRVSKPPRSNMDVPGVGTCPRGRTCTSTGFRWIPCGLSRGCKVQHEQHEVTVASDPRHPHLSTLQQPTHLYAV